MMFYTAVRHLSVYAFLRFAFCSLEKQALVIGDVWWDGYVLGFDPLIGCPRYVSAFKSCKFHIRRPVIVYGACEDALVHGASFMYPCPTTHACPLTFVYTFPRTDTHTRTRIIREISHASV